MGNPNFSTAISGCYDNGKWDVDKLKSLGLKSNYIDEIVSTNCSIMEAVTKLNGDGLGFDGDKNCVARLADLQKANEKVSVFNHAEAKSLPNK